MSRPPHSTRGALAALAFLALVGCAGHRPPEQSLQVTAEDGTRIAPDSLTFDYEVDGVRVIQRPVYDHDVVAVNLYLLGGVRQLTPETQGVESLLLNVAELATERYPRAALRGAIGRTGSRLVVVAERDWSVVAFHGVRQAFDSTWSVFADVVMRPRLDSAEVATVRDRMIAAARRRATSPDAHVYQLANDLAFAGHPYALEEDGVESSLAALDAAALRRYHAEQVVTSRMLLVVVGNVPREVVERRVRETLGTLPRGSYAWTLPAPLPAGAARPARLEARGVTTNYILGRFQGPPTTHEDYPAFRIAMAILSGRISQAVRGERSLSYAAGAPFFGDALASGGIYASTARPDTVLALMRKEIDWMKEQYYPAFALERFVDNWALEYFAQHETSAAQAAYLARSQLLLGDWRRGSHELERMRAVRSPDLRRVVGRYVRDVHFAFVGDTSRVSRERMGKF